MATEDITLGPWEAYFIDRQNERVFHRECFEQVTLSLAAERQEIICNMLEGPADLRDYALMASVDLTFQEVDHRTLEFILGNFFKLQSHGVTKAVGSSSTPTAGDNPEWQVRSPEGNMVIRAENESTWSMSSSGQGAGSGAPSGSSTAGDVYYDRDNDNFWIYDDGTNPFSLGPGWFEFSGYDEVHQSTVPDPSQDPSQTDDLWLVIAIDDSGSTISAEARYSAANDSTWESTADVSAEFDYEAVGDLAGSSDDHTVHWAEHFLANTDIEPDEWEGITGKNPTFPALSTHTSREPVLWGADGINSPFSFTDLTTRIDDISSGYTFDNPDGKTDVPFEHWNVQSVSTTNPDGYTAGDTFTTFGRQYRILSIAKGKIRAYLVEEGSPSDTLVSFDRDENYKVHGYEAEHDAFIQGDDALWYGFAYEHDGLRDSSDALLSDGRRHYVRRTGNKIDAGVLMLHEFHSPGVGKNVYLALRMPHITNTPNLQLQSSNTDPALLTVPTSYRTLAKGAQYPPPVEIEIIEDDSELQRLTQATL